MTDFCSRDEQKPRRGSTCGQSTQKRGSLPTDRPQDVQHTVQFNKDGLTLEYFEWLSHKSAALTEHPLQPYNGHSTTHKRILHSRRSSLIPYKPSPRTLMRSMISTGKRYSSMSWQRCVDICGTPGSRIHCDDYSSLKHSLPIAYRQTRTHKLPLGCWPLGCLSRSSFIPS